MNVQLLWKEGDITLDVDVGTSIAQVLQKANILSSTVIVCYNDRILPHSTLLQQEIALEVITISSGG
jgi:sulfur carrier protein ThiS